MNIFVGNLSFNTTEEEIKRAFDAFGEVDSVKIILDRETLKSRGFGFVTMSNQEQAVAAIAGMNGKELNGFIVKVNEARPREPGGGPPRERSAGGYPSGNRGGYGGFGSSSGSGASGGYGRNRTAGVTDSKDLDIYDTKSGRSGAGHGKKGRGGPGRGSGGGGRPGGGGRRSY